MAKTYLDIISPDVLDIVWFYVHKGNMRRICRIFNRMHTKFCLWSKPSDKLLHLVTPDKGCIQHPYTDFYKFRNKTLCGDDGLQCMCNEPPNFGTCLHCYVIPIKNPWTDLPPFHGLYRCGNCETYGFPCSNCATFFNGTIRPEIFHANF